MNKRYKQITKMFRCTMLCCILIGTVSLTIGCSRIDFTVRVPMIIKSLSLVRMWDDFIKVEQVQEQTTNLISFRLETDSVGNVKNIGFEFDASKDNHSTPYLVSFSNSGEMVLNVGSSFGTTLSTYDPRVLFTELDAIGLTYIQSTSEGFTIDAVAQGFNRDDYISDKSYVLLYHLKDGKLIPLEHVRFDTDKPCGGIRVNQSSHDEAHPHPLQIWFLSEDLAKAQIAQ